MNINDVLLRLEDEEHVCALNSFTASGWGKVLAWNPAAIFVGSDETAVSEIEKLVADQQALGRLLIGYLSYDYGCRLKAVSLTGEGLTTPGVWIAAFDSWLEFNKNKIIYGGQNNKTQAAEILSRKPKKVPGRVFEQPLQPTMSRQAYAGAYQKIKDYIRAGDVYQINLTHRLEGSSKLSGRELFAKFSDSSQADFQAYLAPAGFEILSQSPERFIKVENRDISTMPIKGTRPRGKNPAEDRVLRQQLTESPKDQAELNMITDLMRNDLGEICRPGSVKVVKERTIAKYPTLWHAHSAIQGKLSDDISPVGALLSVLPGGSITGCPKKRAIEIIDELEPVRRGIYTGSIFTIRPDGSLDSNIAIRTMIKQGKKLYLSVGGGIVYDSEEADEYQESLDKARSFKDI
jgi:anthranilate/para-aminobenzoate synthase component I